MTPIKEGDKAPAFRLVSDSKEMVSLGDYSGKNLLLLFFPMAFTSVCTDELCSIRDDLSAYEELSTAVLGISVDSPFTLHRFREEQKINFPLLSDFNKEASTAYGVLYEEFVFGLKGVAKRSTFVIDARGTVRYAEVLDNAGNLPNFAKVKEALSNLREFA